MNGYLSGRGGVTGEGVGAFGVRGGEAEACVVAALGGRGGGKGVWCRGLLVGSCFGAMLD